MDRTYHAWRTDEHVRREITGPAFYYCHDCDLAYMASDTHAYYAPGFPSATSARQCPTCAHKLTPVNDDDVDPSVFDYLAPAW